MGIDLVSIARIERAMRDARFVERILSPEERKLNLNPRFVAGRWAAKEAIAKCLQKPLSWQAVKILQDAAGAPVASIKDCAFDPESMKVHVSITHDGQYAAAVAVIETTS